MTLACDSMSTSRAVSQTAMVTKYVVYFGAFTDSWQVNYTLKFIDARHESVIRSLVIFMRELFDKQVVPECKSKLTINH